MGSGTPSQTWWVLRNQTNSSEGWPSCMSGFTGELILANKHTKVSKKSRIWNKELSYVKTDNPELISDNFWCYDRWKQRSYIHFFCVQLLCNFGFFESKMVCNIYLNLPHKTRVSWATTPVEKPDLGQTGPIFSRKARGRESCCIGYWTSIHTKPIINRHPWISSCCLFLARGYPRSILIWGRKWRSISGLLLSIFFDFHCTTAVCTYVWYRYWVMKSNAARQSRGRRVDPALNVNQ